MPAPVYTIAPGVPFVDVLAAGVLQESAVDSGDDPLALAAYTILLPTRRACRALRDAFLRAAGGRALLLPAMRPVGDVDEDELALGESGLEGGVGGPESTATDLPPAIPGLRRRLLLARAVLGWQREGDPLSADEAARLAAELERLLDQVQTERLSFDGLAGLVPEDYARHWQHTVSFLEILTRHWPDVLAEEGALDPAVRRNLLLGALTEAWRTAPPPGPVIAAGTTGTVPATADLLACVAALPRGRIVLPGLFGRLAPESWARIREEPTHPQYNMARLLARLKVDPADVMPWPAAPPPASLGPADRPALVSARETLLTETMRPAAESDAWQSLSSLPAGALAGIERVDCADAAEEAGVIALALRRALDVPGRTAVLVTPDRDLARRVAAEMRRWDVDIDDSAGRPLAHTPPGLFLTLLAAAALDFAPVPLLALLKHPLAAAGRPAAHLRALTRLLERTALRGPRPGAGFAALAAAVRAAGLPPADASGLMALTSDLDRQIGPFVAAVRHHAADLSHLLDAHLVAAEALAADGSGPGAARLWAGDAGEALAGFVAELRETAGLLPPMPGRCYGALFSALLEGRVVRPRFGSHPRCAILGPLEARLQSFDVAVLGGLNEGTWPPEPRPDPWLSRPMRRAFGLPPQDRKIGLAAHDFVAAFAAPDVLLTRASKVEGQPTVPSRWLTRLDAVLAAAGAEGALAGGEEWRSRYAALQRPDGLPSPGIPEPRPPVAARPRRLSVTQVEAWMRNPYAIYARHVLRLRPLDPIDADPGAAERGTFIHDAIDQFLKETPGDLPADALDRLLALGEAAFGAALDRPAVRAFWWPRFARIAEWFVAAERLRRPDLAETVTEVGGWLEVAGPAGPFRLTAKADRVDRLRAGGYEIIDYKTGVVPSEKEVGLGFAPQLPLEAAIAAAGGFAGVPAGPVAALSYWRLSGGSPPGEEKPIKGSAAALGARALDGLAALVAAFDDPETPYRPTPRPDFAPRFDDYAHLARSKEWGGERAE